MYKSVDIVMLYLVDVNVKYHHISIPKQSVVNVLKDKN